jgi:hypothetical protein
MPVMFYSSDGLRDLIVAAWANRSWTDPAPGGLGTVPKLGDALTDRDPLTGLPSPAAKATAKAAVNAMAGLDLKSVVVITEAEHDDDYTMQDDEEVVFVLPRPSRSVIASAPGPFPVPPYPAKLLETAKLLMACTPNGI